MQNALYPPRRPLRESFEARTERRYIFEFAEHVLHYDECDEEEREKIKNEIDIESVDLQLLISKVPEGIPLNKIKIDFGYEVSRYRTENHYIKFYYEVNLPDDKAGFKKAEAQYKKDLAKYEKDKLARTQAEIDASILEAENEVQRLKELRDSAT